MPDGDAPRCKAFTYVKAGVQNNDRVLCYLKDGTPAPVLNANVDSGPTLANPSVGLYSGLVETHVDRPDQDYRSFDLSQAQPELCREACRNESHVCKAYTYLRPGGGNPLPRCFLKSGIPAPVASPPVRLWHQRRAISLGGTTNLSGGRCMVRCTGGPMRPSPSCSKVIFGVPPSRHANSASSRHT
ncbi:PAN domain-containing protein [Stigmatella aurantiaca]|nr:PAN domain-containing protein [Stigmatella aurantiaca]